MRNLLRNLLRNQLLDHFPPADCEHSGLALQRLVLVKSLKDEEHQRSLNGEEHQRQDLINIVNHSCSGSPAYANAYECWSRNISRGAQFTATTNGPLAIGLGNASPYEVGLTLHHTFGVPYLPASALKGLALRVARQHRDDLGDELIRYIFGDDGQNGVGGSLSAGNIIFFDGWLVPKKGQFLQLDTITVHHPKYYQGGDELPTDFDDPVPVPFVSVCRGLDFELRVGVRDKVKPDYATLAAQLLRHGLCYLGLGGKTNAGYGGFDCNEVEAILSAEEQKERDELKKFDARVNELLIRIADMNMRPSSVNNEIARTIDQIKDMPKKLRDDIWTAFLDRVKGDTRTKGDKQLIKRIKKEME